MLAVAAGQEERIHTLSVMKEPDRSCTEVAMLRTAAKKPDLRAVMMSVEVSALGREKYLQTVEALDPMLRGQAEAQMLRVMTKEARKEYLRTLDPAKKPWIPALNLPKEVKPEEEKQDPEFPTRVRFRESLKAKSISPKRQSKIKEVHARVAEGGLNIAKMQALLREQETELESVRSGASPSPSRSPRHHSPYYPYKEGELEKLLWGGAGTKKDPEESTLQVLTRLGLQTVARATHRGSYHDTHAAIAHRERSISPARYSLSSTSCPSSPLSAEKRVSFAL